MMLQILVVVAVALVTGANGFITCAFAGCMQTCRNKFLIGYECICKPGFSVDPDNHKNCLPVVVNCYQGFEPDPSKLGQCRDINECVTSRPCDQVCTNIPASYICSCTAGYHVDPLNGNKCQLDRPKCPPGYQPSSADPTGCVDINECTIYSPCDQNCFNLPGDYRCSCRIGFVVNEQDNNMCSEIQICTKNQDIILVLDSSGSMEAANNELQLQFASKFVNHFQVGNSKARFGALLFSDNVEELFDLQDYSTTADVAAAIRRAPYHRFTTRTDVALDYIRENRMFSTASGGRSNAPNIVVVFTDGQSDFPDLTRAAANRLKGQNVSIIAVGIGNEVSMNEFYNIASSPYHVFVAPDFESLDYIEQNLSNRVCQS